jgi:hypothetical protein
MPDVLASLGKLGDAPVGSIEFSLTMLAAALVVPVTSVVHDGGAVTSSGASGNSVMKMLWPTRR